MPTRSKAPVKRAASHNKAPPSRPSVRSRAPVKRARAASAPNAAPSSCFSQAAITRNFLSICRDAFRDKAKVYVKDRAGEFYLTLDPIKRHLDDPIIDVSAQEFKDNFSRFSSLIKDGLCFRLSYRVSKVVIYARRHTRYSDPLDYVIEQWREKVAEAASTKQQEEKLRLAIMAMSRQGELQNEEVLKRFGNSRTALPEWQLDTALLTRVCCPRVAIALSMKLLRNNVPERENSARIWGFEEAA